MLRSVAEGLAARNGSPRARSGVHDAIAGVLAAQGKYPESEAEYRRSIEMLEDAVGPDDPQLAVEWNNLAVALAHQRKYSAAETEFRRVIELRR